MGRALTGKQEAFCVKYVECGDASKAYRFAYSCKNMKAATINRCAKEVLDNPKIAARIKKLQKATASKLLISKNSVLREYARLGFSDIRDLFDDEGLLLNIHKLETNIARAISSIKVVTKSKGEGEVEYVSEIKLWPKNPALEALAKNLGLFDKDSGDDIEIDPDESYL